MIFISRFFFVDSLYIRRFGRRKSWLVPVQYCIGVTMLLLAQNVDYYLDSTPPDVFSLTCMFFFLNFLAATQDIAGKYFIFTILLVSVIRIVYYAFLVYLLISRFFFSVDGWALTMLKRKNVGYASTCNSVGQTAGKL